ncbi:MAG: SulP family inorganic anion transporter, partial [Paracoccus sp. (in: a-proteobacteria)]|nr:SulP family inorganic anion transporter [Paracoccus sp. (in: a-proteobacteria)]
KTTHMKGCIMAPRRPKGHLPGKSDILGGLTLAAITIPEQIATARLGGFPPQLGLYAFVGATLGFALLGRSRVMTVGADSTITPIFAVALAGLAATHGADPIAAAALLAVLVGLVLLLAGVLRLGYVANLLSVPVVTGFLAGIAVHIVGSQLPALMGVAAQGDTLPQQLLALVRVMPQANPWTMAVGLSVLAAMVLTERMAPRLPGALIGLGLAMLATWVFGLDRMGVTTLGPVAPVPWKPLAAPSLELLPHLVPLALLVALVVMMQTAAVDRGFPGGAEDINADFRGLGAGNLASAALGAFPVNASPPRTAAAVAAGITSQMGALTAAGVVAVLALTGGGLMAAIPHAALAGVLLFVVGRIFRIGALARIARRAPTEGLLAILTLLAVVVLPIQAGIATGIGLALLHGVWSATHSSVQELTRIPGTTIWWPAATGEREPGVLVAAFQAPLLFSNAENFRAQLLALIAARGPLHLLVLEASAIADVDYTAAEVLGQVIADCHGKGIHVSIARLESLRAARSLTRHGILDLIQTDARTHSVEEAIRYLDQRGGLRPMPGRA